jgi:hypothetical protein
MIERRDPRGGWGPGRPIRLALPQDASLQIATRASSPRLVDFSNVPRAVRDGHARLGPDCCILHRSPSGSCGAARKVAPKPGCCRVEPDGTPPASHWLDPMKHLAHLGPGPGPGPRRGATRETDREKAIAEALLGEARGHDERLGVRRGGRGRDGAAAPGAGARGSAARRLAEARGSPFPPRAALSRQGAGGRGATVAARRTALRRPRLAARLAPPARRLSGGSPSTGRSTAAAPVAPPAVGRGGRP